MSKSKNPVGRPPIEFDLDNVERLAAQGLTQIQIAAALGMGESTLYEKRLDYPEFSEALKRGKAKGIATITNALFTGAKGGNVASQIFYLKNQAGWRDKPADEEEEEKVREFKVTLTHENEADSSAD